MPVMPIIARRPLRICERAEGAGEWQAARKRCEGKVAKKGLRVGPLPHKPVPAVCVVSRGGDCAVHTSLSFISASFSGVPQNLGRKPIGSNPWVPARRAAGR